MKHLLSENDDLFWSTLAENGVRGITIPLTPLMLEIPSVKYLVNDYKRYILFQ